MRARESCAFPRTSWWWIVTAWLDWTADLGSERFWLAKDFDCIAEDFLNSWGHPEFLRTSWIPEDFLNSWGHHQSTLFLRRYSVCNPEDVLNSWGRPEFLRESWTPEHYPRSWQNSFQSFQISYEQTSSGVFLNVIATYLFLTEICSNPWLSWTLMDIS